MSTVSDRRHEDDREVERAAVERLMLFTDAVVAIAITLLVLPLVDLAREDGSIGDLWRDNRGQFVAFGVSFLVIAKLWAAHHSRMRSISRCPGQLVWCDMLWLATIVFLPFTTELLGGPRGDETSTRVMYVGSVLACTLAFDLLEWVASQLRDDDGPDRAVFVEGWVPSVLTAIALVVVAVAPALGLWPMALLMLSGPVTGLAQRWVLRRRGSQPDPDPGS